MASRIDRILKRHMLVETCDLDGEFVTYDGHGSFAYDNEGSSAGAGYMPKQNLFHLARYAQSVHDSLDDGDPVEDWVEDKVAKALADMEDVADYVLYRRSRNVAETYRVPPAGDAQLPPHFDYDSVWREYFDDAVSGLNMSRADAQAYADEHADDDRLEHVRQMKLYQLKARPSKTRGRYPGGS